MSEAVCGPSNALQQFKQQTQVDRSLQQDRLATRHAGSSTFRSANNSRMIDAEFEAFQAGAPLTDLPAFHPQHELPIAAPAPFAAQGLPSWAADFQRLQVSAPMPIQQRQPAFAQEGPSWASDFRQHLAQPVPRAQSSSPSPWAFQQRARYGYTGSSYGSQGFMERPASKGKQAVTDMDDAAFAAAFDQIAQETEMHEDEAVHMETHKDDMFENPETMEDVINKALKDSMFDPETVLGQVAIDEPESFANSEFDYNGAPLQEHMADIIHQEQQPVEEPVQQESRVDDDALAYTAGELLDRVKDNQSDKFQNSQFLALMQKLKDREVRVEGDKMVETVGSTSIPYVYAPKRHHSPDSGYGSTPSTPPLMQEPVFASSAGETSAAECDVLEEHRWDHWESPYT